MNYRIGMAVIGRVNNKYFYGIRHLLIYTKLYYGNPLAITNRQKIVNKLKKLK